MDCTQLSTFERSTEIESTSTNANTANRWPEPAQVALVLRRRNAEDLAFRASASEASSRASRASGWSIETLTMGMVGTMPNRQTCRPCAPSTSITAPLTYDAASVHKKVMTAATSSAVP